MAQKLSIIGKVIGRESRKLLRFPDVMADCGCDEQITVQDWICIAEIISQLRNTERMFQQPAYKTMMDGFCSR